VSACRAGATCARLRTTSALLLVAVVAAAAWLVPARQAGYVWQLPAGFPVPRVPADNPMSAVKVELGRHLFYDKRLSQNGTQACASCHRQEYAFTDGRTHGVGSTGQAHVRNSMTLTNVAYASRLTWANGLLDRLEDQALVPMFGDTPIELGLRDEAVLHDRLAADPAYVALFAAAFPDERAPITIGNVTRAIASFERTLISANSPYDRYTRGDADALSPSARRGMELFLSERLECFHCHGGFDFSDAIDHRGMAEPERAFHNNGLYDLDGKGAYPASDRGLIVLTGRPEDMGRFKAPTLRNVAVTAPYMHDGSIATLDEVIDHYAAGGRTIASGPNAGVGSDSPRKDAFVAGFVLSAAERVDLIAFLRSLTDGDFLTDPRFADPLTPTALSLAAREADK
jgi:cytochrome c peroxidase